jgi:uncharacterized protein (TIGR00255 family)
MLRSMTGFGAGGGRAGEEETSVEIRSVNHKFCEVKVRLPQELMPLEPEIVKQVKEAVRRGALDVTVRRRSTGRAALLPRVDRDLAREYVAALDEIASELGLAKNLGIAELAQVEGIVRLEERGVGLDDARRSIREALAAALAGLLEMREKEGRALEADLLARVALLRANAETVRGLSPRSVDQYHARLAERVAELSRGMPVEPQRLATEIAIFAERVDVAEELTRLASHLEQLEQLCAGGEPAGRRMDFLVQEIHREVNTIGAKNQSAEISHLVVSMKAEVERVREQVQNVE